jgi:hypothetical protein
MEKNSANPNECRSVLLLFLVPFQSFKHCSCHFSHFLLHDSRKRNFYIPPDTTQSFSLAKMSLKTQGNCKNPYSTALRKQSLQPCGRHLTKKLWVLSACYRLFPHIEASQERGSIRHTCRRGKQRVCGCEQASERERIFLCKKKYPRGR